MARQYRSTVEAKTLSTGINSSVTSMTLNSVTTLPTTYPYTLVINPDTATEEIVTVTALSSGTTLVITRGQDGTSAQTHDAAAVVKHMITARDLQEPHDHIDATAGVHGITGSVVGTSDTQALTNKTLTSPTISGTITGAVVTSANIVNGTIVNADINDSAAIVASKLSGVVTPDGTETLTNKTLTSPTITGSGFDAWQSYTATFTGVNVGNGTQAFAFCQIGKTVHVRGSFTLGASSGITGSITFTVPTAATAGATASVVGNALFVDTGTAAYSGLVRSTSSTAFTINAMNAAGTFTTSVATSSSNPFLWGNGDSFEFTCTYEAA